MYDTYDVCHLLHTTTEAALLARTDLLSLLLKLFKINENKMRVYSKK